eukprot:2656630-Alexandrium_andersonii.AAC.1
MPLSTVLAEAEDLNLVLSPGLAEESNTLRKAFLKASNMALTRGALMPGRTLHWTRAPVRISNNTIKTTHGQPTARACH